MKSQASSSRITSGMLLSAVVRLKWYAVGGFIAGAVIAVAIALSKQTLYESSALLASPRSGDSSGRLAALLGQAAQLGALLGLPDVGGADTNETIAILKSRSFSMRFVEKQQMLPHLYFDEWDAEANRWQPGFSLASVFQSANAQSDPAKGPPQEEVLERLDAWRAATVDRRTGLVRVSMRAPNPELARKWLAALIEEINVDVRSRELESASKAVILIRERLAEESLQEVRVGLASLLESELKREVAVQTRPDFALRVIDPPTLPSKPVAPRPVRMLALGAVLGAMLATMLGALLILVRRARSSS